jgi:hypothetical protein
MNSLCSVVSGQKYDHEQIKKEVNQIYQEHNCLSQIGLTHSSSNLTEEEKIIECTGSIYDYGEQKYKSRETDFTVFNERYKNTYLYEIYRNLPSIGRFRIMTMHGPCCYTIHKDLSKRYHYVVETNVNCIFLFPTIKQQVHIPCDGNLYLLETRLPHTFVNGSRETRIHLVLDDLSTLPKR